MSVQHEQAEMVIVEWTIERGRDQEFFAFRRPVPPSTPGFLGEQLYRAEVDGDRETVMYVNIGHWSTRAAFHAGVPGVTEGFAPEPQDFEDAPRRRLWLSPVG
jgi:heme-degrading monooxygenase HmoA